MNDRITEAIFSLVMVSLFFICSVAINMVQYSRVRDLTIEKHNLQSRVWILENYIRDNK